LLLRGITLWTIWAERNDLTFNIIKWEIGKVQQTISHGLNYVRLWLDWAKALKDALRVAIYDNALANFDSRWDVNKLLYPRINTRRVHWNTYLRVVSLIYYGQLSTCWFKFTSKFLYVIF
jgi:hypothetical protein